MEQFDLRQLMPMIIIGLVFYLFIVRPQSKQKKKKVAFLEGLKNNQNIVTESGIHGKIVSIDRKDKTCVVETLSGKIKLEVDKISMDMTSYRNTSES